jgi:hypothetical protein
VIPFILTEVKKGKMVKAVPVTGRGRP